MPSLKIYRELSHSLSSYTGGWFKSPQEQRLAIGLLVCVSLFAGFRLWKAGQGLWSTQHARIERLESELQELNTQIDTQRNVTLARLQRQPQSLPADSTVAATRYYAFLHDLAAKHGWQDVKIDAASPIDQPGVGQRISLSIQARAAVESIGSLLDEFASYPWLHGLTHMQLNDLSPGGRDGRVSLTIEAISLPQASIDIELRLADGRNENDHGLAAAFSQRNPFRRYEPPRPVVTTPVVTAPVIDHLSKVRFVGIVQRDGVPQAWFYDSLTNSELMLIAGKSVTIDDFDGQLQSIDDQQVIITSHDSSITMNLGQDLRAALQKEANDE